MTLGICFLPCLTCLFTSVFQQAFNAAVAINHMKKLQLAHSEASVKQSKVSTTLPDIKVISASNTESAEKNLIPDHQDPNGNLHSRYMIVPAMPTEIKSQYYPTKSSHRLSLTVAEKSKHVYHSEPANLNGCGTLFNISNLQIFYI